MSRDGRVVDCGGLENRWNESFRGFESLSLRQKKRRVFNPSFLLGYSVIRGGFEGGSRFAGAKRFALRGKDKANLIGKGRR